MFEYLLIKIIYNTCFAEIFVFVVKEFANGLLLDPPSSSKQNKHIAKQNVPASRLLKIEKI